MFKRLLAIGFLALASAWPHAGHAAATFIAAANARDMVYDFRRNILYIADGAQVQRYSIGSNRLLSPIPLLGGAQARGIDISRDGMQLAVADQATDATHGWVQVVNLATLGVSKRSFTRDYYEGGTWSVAFAADASLMVTSSFNGSGWVPLRRLVPATGAWTTLYTITQDTMLAASTDRQTIAFAESNISDGAWGLYDLPTHQLVIRNGYDNGTSSFNWEITTDAAGGQFAIPTGADIQLYDPDFARTSVAPPLNGHYALAAAFHPVRPLLYYSWSNTGQVRVTNTFSKKMVAWYDMGDVFPEPDFRFAYLPGRLKLSPDGSLLMALANGGVRYLRLYAPLAAANVAATVNSGVATDIALKGSIGNNDPLTYAVHALPHHGKLGISGSVARYQPAAGFHGADSFRYIVRYGAAAYAVATVSITVR